MSLGFSWNTYQVIPKDQIKLDKCEFDAKAQIPIGQQNFNKYIWEFLNTPYESLAHLMKI